METTRWGSSEKIKGWDGLNNAAINTFNSNVISSFVRENIQNSNDAREKLSDGNRKKLYIEIEYKNIDSAHFPNHTQFLEIFKKIAADPNNAKHQIYFRKALEAISNKDEIGVLIYRDFNTTGLKGEDDDANSSFNACVLSEGQSVKDDDDSGGSYGIGKNSIFAISKIRTIMYTSFNIEEETIIQGVSKLASYREDSKTFESRIFFGIGDRISSIRDRHISSIPSTIINEYKRKKPGLSQYAFCPDIEKGWVINITKAILKNYWPLLINDELEVKITDKGVTSQIVSSGTLNDLMDKYYSPGTYDPDDSEPKGNPYDYYSCYKKCTPKDASVHMLGSIRFYYNELEHKMTNRVLYIRNGMVISAEEIWGFGSIGYCGIVECTNVEGNIYLKMMEPPEHNRFDTARINEKSDKYKSTDGEKAFKEIKRIIRDSLNEILNKYRKKAEDIPWLNNLLQSIKGLNGSGSGNRTGQVAERETIERVYSMPKRTLAFSTINTNSQTTTLGTEDVPPPTPAPPSPSPLPSPRPTPPPKGSKKVRFRIYKKSNEGHGVGIYKILIDSDDTINNKSLNLKQVGDSGNAASFELIEVKDRNGLNIIFEEIRNKEKELIAYQINSVDIPNQLEIKVKEPYKSTFTIQAI